MLCRLAEKANSVQGLTVVTNNFPQSIPLILFIMSYRLTKKANSVQGLSDVTNLAHSVQGLSVLPDLFITANHLQFVYLIFREWITMKMVKLLKTYSAADQVKLNLGMTAVYLKCIGRCPMQKIELMHCILK